MTDSRNRQSRRPVVDRETSSVKDTTTAPRVQPSTSSRNSKRKARDDRPEADRPLVKRSNKSSLASHQPSKNDHFPSHKILSKASDQTLYHRALLLKQNHNPTLLELDQELSTSTVSASDLTTAKTRLEQVLKWKMLRGKYRVTLSALLARNSPDEISAVVAKALQQMKTVKTVDGASDSGALLTMAKLQGVGPATASAFLSFEAPSLVPFFSDEAASFFEPCLGPIKYTFPFYKKFVASMVARLEEISRDHSGWDLGRLERALWTMRVLKQKLSKEEWIQALGDDE